MVGRSLTTDTDVFSLRFAGLDGHCQHRQNGLIAFIEDIGDERPTHVGLR